MSKRTLCVNVCWLFIPFLTFPAPTYTVRDKNRANECTTEMRRRALCWRCHIESILKWLYLFDFTPKCMSNPFISMPLFAMFTIFVLVILSLSPHHHFSQSQFSVTFYSFIRSFVLWGRICVTLPFAWGRNINILIWFHNSDNNNNKVQ